METLQLVKEIEALPEQARAAVERLVALLKTRYATSGDNELPILYPADPAQAGQPFTDPDFFGAWAARTDITSGAEYIHDVRRGLRPA